jgi:hypothetical protein
MQVRLTPQFLRALHGRGERRSPGIGRPQDAPATEAIVSRTFYETINPKRTENKKMLPKYLRKKGKANGISPGAGAFPNRAAVPTPNPYFRRKAEDQK